MLTIIATTFNRPRYLSRLLNYLGAYNLKYPVFVADASESTHLERNKETIRSLSTVLTVRHLVWDRWAENYEVLFRSLEQVDTEYVVWLPDDDFIVPSALDSVVEFMNRNPSYEAAQGRQILFTTSSGGPYSTSPKIAPLNMVDFSVEGASASDRIRKRMAQNTRLGAPKASLAVMRTANALRLYREVLALGLDHSSTEGIMGQLVLLSGNIKLIDRLYIARQYDSANLANHAHVRYVPIITQSNTGELYEPLVDMRLDEKISHRPDFFDLLVDPLFHIKYERMVTCLASELSRQDGISIEESRKIIKYWQWYFLAKNMMPKFYEHTGYQENTIGTETRHVSKRLRQWARHVPGLKQIWRKLRLVSGGQMSAAASLHLSSNFRDDFMPIYRAVTVQPEGTISKVLKT